MLLLLPSAGEWAGNGMQLPGHCGSHWDEEQAGSIFREVTEELVTSSRHGMAAVHCWDFSVGAAPVDFWKQGRLHPSLG